jgi:hypothetical protein
MGKVENPGYHINQITKGVLGEISKIQEEVDELTDAQQQGCKIMELVELSDLYGAIECYLRTYHSETSMADLAKMSQITQRAFTSGRR